MKNINIKKITKNLSIFTLIVFLSFAVFVPSVSFGQLSGDPIDPPAGSGGSTTIDNPIGVDNLNDFIKTILEGIIKIGIPVIAIAIIYSGFLFVTAQGKPQAIEEAKRAFLYTLIGAAILLGSWALAQLISDTVLQL